MGRTASPAVALFIFALVLALCPSPARADDFIARQKSLIRVLYESKNYFSTIAETRRLLEYAPGDARAGDWRYFLETNYFLGGQAMTVVAHLAGKGVARDPNSFLLLSRAYFAKRMYAECAHALDELALLPIEADMRLELALRRAELSLTGGNFGGARSALDDPGAAHPEARALFARDIETSGPPAYRSPALAALFSAALPGSGQVYAGRWADALVSVFALAVLSYGSWRASADGQRGAAVSLGFITGLAYAGTVYGAWNAARSFNAAASSQLASGLIARHVPGFDPMKHLDYKSLFE
jgi:hypothetical protein